MLIKKNWYDRLFSLKINTIDRKLYVQYFCVIKFLPDENSIF